MLALCFSSPAPADPGEYRQAQTGEVAAIQQQRRQGLELALPGSLPGVLHALPAAPPVRLPALSCTFNVTIPDTPWTADLLPSVRQLITQHVTEAGRRWVEPLVLGSPCSIEVEFHLDPDIPTANGRSLTSVQVGTAGGRAMYEQGVAHELRTGNDPNGGDTDMEINFGVDYFRDLIWLDPQPEERTAPIPELRVDGLSVILHEFGHAIAYNGWADGQGHPPDGFWSYFDRWMLPGTPPFFGGPQSVAAWGGQPDLTLNNVHHWGNDTLSLVSPSRAREPVAWKDGRPVPRLSHDAWRTVKAPPATHGRGQSAPQGLIDQLMNGVVFYYQYRYDISDLDRAVLEDVGLEFSLEDIFSDGFEN